MCAVSLPPPAAACSCRLVPKISRVRAGPFCAVWLAVALGIPIVPSGRAQVPAPARVWMPFSHLGTGVTVGTTGLGVEAAVPYGAYWNIRAGVSYLGYSQTFHSSASPI